MQRVSVIVASHRPRYIESLVRGFHASIDTPSSLCELIVVADYPIDDLQTRYSKVRWEFMAERSIPAKRNRGVSLARNNIVAFIDDDCVPSGDWIQRALEYLDANPDIAGVEGKTTIQAGMEAGGAYREFKRLERRGFRTNNIFYRKEVFLSAGGFDERFTVQREDIDLAFTIMDNGHSIGYCEAVAVEHTLRHGEPWDLLKNCWNRRFDPLLYKKHPHRYRQYVGTPFPPSIAGLGIAYLAAFFFGFVFVPVCAFTLGVILSACLVLSVRRHHAAPIRVDILVADFVSFAVSPIVLSAALVHGSCRFKILFIV